MAPEWAKEGRSPRMVMDGLSVGVWQETDGPLKKGNLRTV